MNAQPTDVFPDSQRNDYDSLTHGAGLADGAPRGRFAVTGRDRAAFLHRFCTNHITGLAPGQSCEAFFCNAQGKIVGFADIFCLPESFVVETAAGQAERSIAHLDRYVLRDDAQFVPRQDDWSELIVVGPQSRERLAALFGEPLDGCAWRTWQGRRVLAAPVARYGVAGFLLFADRADMPPLHAALVELGLRPVSAVALDMVRREAGAPDFGRDITEANLPQEVDRNAQAIHFSKGCYLGQETVARIDALGHVNRQLVGVLTATEPAAQAELSRGGKVVGYVTSTGWSPRWGAFLSLAYVRREHSAADTELQTAGVSARVVPFVRE